MSLHVNGLHEFQTQCTLPNFTANYVTSPNTRGSLDLVWSSFATAIACVYSVLHFNIPPQLREDDEDANSQEDRRHGWWQAAEQLYVRNRRVIMPVFWSVFTVFVPEIAYTTALFECWEAWDQVHALRKFLRDHRHEKDYRFADPNRWTITHMFYANMGGFVIEHSPKSPSKVVETGIQRMQAQLFTRLKQGDASKEKSIPRNAQDESRAKHADDRERDARNEKASSSRDATASLSGNVVHHDHTNSATRAEDDEEPPQKIDCRTSDQVYEKFHLNAITLRRAIEEGWLLPYAVPEIDIDDQAKTDSFTKLLVVLQILSFFIQILARVGEHLAVSPLEVVVSAFAVCSIIPYFVQWDKPRNATATITLATFEAAIPSKFVILKKRTPNLGMQDIEDLIRKKKNGHSESDKNKDVSGPPHAIEPTIRGLRENRWWILLLCCGGAVFGGIHLAAWDLHFPTIVDKWLWRSSSIATAALPVLWAIPALLRSEHQLGKEKKSQMEDTSKATRRSRLPTGPMDAAEDSAGLDLERMQSKIPELEGWKFLFVPGLVMYSTARLILVVETIRTLFYLPPEVYRTPNWSLGVPHIS